MVGSDEVFVPTCDRSFHFDTSILPQITKIDKKEKPPAGIIKKFPYRRLTYEKRVSWTFGIHNKHANRVDYNLSRQYYIEHQNHGNERQKQDNSNYLMYHLFLLIRR